MADTGAEVAKAAGVSVATVSRVFTSPEVVRPETRQRVLDAAATLGYNPKSHTRTVPRARTNQLGVVLPNLANPFFAGIAKAVHARARQRGCAIVVADSDEHEPDEPELALDMAGRVDGIVLVSARSPESVLQRIAGQVPTVLTSRRAEGVTSVVAPHLPGTVQAADHLRALGHRKCCYVDAGRDDPTVRARMAQLKEHCTQIGLEFVDLGYFAVSFDSGIAAASLVAASQATAVLVNNDLITLGLVSGLTQQGIAVPGDISVVGIGDAALAASCNPPLTSVHIPIRDMGRRAVDLLLDQLSDPGMAPQDLELPSSLVVGSSTARVGGHRSGS